jgi:hypothetical protein
MRVAAWRQAHGRKELDLYLSKDGCDLNTPRGYQVVADSLRALKRKPALVVVDTLHRFMSGDENSAQDAKAMIDNCQRIIDEFGCAVILVHHTPKTNATEARGSSSWKGALDIEINISGDGPVKKVQHMKMKEVEEYQTANVRLETIPLAGWLDEDGEQVTSAVIRTTEESAKNQENPKARRSKEEMSAEFRRTFETCWRESGREMAGDFPYVSRAALKAIIEKNLGAPAAKAAFRDDKPGRMIVFMCNHDLLRPDGNGYAIKDSAWASILALQSADD